MFRLSCEGSLFPPQGLPRLGPLALTVATRRRGSGTIDTLHAETWTGQLEFKPRAVGAIRARGTAGRVDVRDTTVTVHRIVARAVDTTTSEILYLGGKGTYIFIDVGKKPTKKNPLRG